MKTQVQQVKREVMVPGRWYQTNNPEPQWVGVCGKCKVTRAAARLEVVRLPFGKGEVWACRGGCW